MLLPFTVVYGMGHRGSAITVTVVYGMGHRKVVNGLSKTARDSL